MENIVVGEGIDGLLGYLVRLLVTEGDAVVTSDGAYPTFNYHVAGFGGVLHKVPYTGDHEDPQALIAKAAEVDAKLVYFANPDNPMGSWHDAATVQAMIDALPEGTVLALDEAYCRHRPRGRDPASRPEPSARHPVPHLLQGLRAGRLRVGYGLAAPDFVAAFNRIRNHFGVGRVAQAGALAALADQGHLMRVVGDIAAARRPDRRDRAGQRADAAAVGDEFRDDRLRWRRGFRARRAVGLVARGIFVRMPFTPPQDRCIRVSCGPATALDAFRCRRSRKHLQMQGKFEGREGIFPGNRLAGLFLRQCGAT
jgi:histidinol-phosphate aminotransferase